MKACSASNLSSVKRVGAILIVLLVALFLKGPAPCAAEESNAKAEDKIVPQSKAAYERGRKQAGEEIARNVLAIEQPGLPAPWMADYMAKLSKDYHIAVRLTGCVMTPDTVSFQQGFNEVMVVEIEKRHGKDVLRKTAEEAQKQFQARSSQK